MIPWNNPRATEIVLGHLRVHPGATAKQIRDATSLARRTIYSALHNLRKLGLIWSRPSLRDARQTHHFAALVVVA